MPRSMMAFLALLLAAVVIGGCGGDDDEAAQNGSGAQDGEPVTVRVGVLPIEGLEPLYIAIERGFFEEEGIRVEPQTAQGGAAIIPGIVSGDLQFGFSNNVSLLLAVERGLPVRILTNGTDGPMPDQEENIGFSIVASAEGSDIQDADDLAGKSVAVNTLRNIGPVLVNKSLEERGVDHEQIEYTEIPFPEMLAAVEQGSVDAVWLVEPFSTLARDQGANVLVQPYVEAMPGRSIATYFTSASYAEENPAVVEGFRRALERGTEFAAENPDVARETLLTYTEIPEEVAERMVLSVFTTEVNPDDFRYLSDLMQRYGLMEGSPDIDELLSLSQ